MVQDFGTIEPKIKLIPLIHRLDLEDLVCQSERDVLNCLFPTAKASYVHRSGSMDRDFILSTDGN